MIHKLRCPYCRWWLYARLRYGHVRHYAWNDLGQAYRTDLVSRRTCTD